MAALRRWMCASFILFFLFPPSVPAEVLPGLNHPNILLITVDCLRPDHMGLYGYRRSTTPNIDRFFSAAARFNQAISQSSWTSPSMISLLTGLYPSVHGMDARGKYFDAGFYTPLDQLRERGYVNLGYAVEHNYANQGWTGEIKKGTLVETLKKIGNGRFFAWYHFREPHLPYAPPEPFRPVFLKPDRPLSGKKWDLLARREKIPRGSVEFLPEDAGPIRDLYDGEVLYQDHELGPLFEFLKTSGLADKTIIILTADHGEELMEHGFIGHASTSLQATVFEEVIRVPLLIRVPGGEWDQPIVAVVQQVDLMPTLFDLMGVEPKFEFQGRSLAPLMARRKDTSPELAFIETSYCGWQCPEDRKKERIHAVRSPEWKLVEERKKNRTVYSLYNLKEDPGEKRNVYGEEPNVAKRFRSLLRDRQRANLELARSLAVKVMDRHSKRARKFISHGQFDRAIREMESALHLDEIYRVENPSFVEDPQWSPGWTGRVKKVYEILGRAYSGKAKAIRGK